MNCETENKIIQPHYSGVSVTKNVKGFFLSTGCDLSPLILVEITFLEMMTDFIKLSMWTYEVESISRLRAILQVLSSAYIIIFLFVSISVAWV